MIVERDRQIGEHRPTPFWKIIVPMGGWKLTSKQIADQNQAQRILDFANMPDALFDVTVKERKLQHDRPPRLYDLTGLQKDMVKLHGLSAAQTLAALQNLYEKKLTTYPRTDSRYITHDDLGMLHQLVEGKRIVTGFIDPENMPNMPRFDLVVNDAKVAGHTAILPTMQAESSSLEGLPEPERLVLTRVVRRMREAIGEDYVHEVTNVTAQFSNEFRDNRLDDPNGSQGVITAGTRFVSHSDQPISLGWKSIEHADSEKEREENEENEESRNVIPSDLEPGCDVALASEGTSTMRKGETKPPKPFTEATLLAAMEHASRFIGDKDLKEALDDDESHSGGIGTPATRAEVIEKLIRSEYVERKGKQLRSTLAGRNLITVSPVFRNVEYTARMEQNLSQVERGEQSAPGVMNPFREDVAGIPGQVGESARLNGDAIRPWHRKAEAESYGPCPKCGQPVIRKGKFWQCSTNKREKQSDGTWLTVGGCGWKLYQTICGKTLTDPMVKTMLEKHRIHANGFTSKNGKKFFADLILDLCYGVKFKFGS